MARRPMLAATFVLILCGCGREQPAVGEAVQLAEPHLAQFAEFDAWARRASESAPAFDAAAALQETAFAPIRNDRRVLAAWIESARPHPGQLALPLSAQVPRGLHWVNLRRGELPDLRVASVPGCALGLPHWWRRPVDHCVLLSRSVAMAGDEALVVTVAYRPATAPGSESTPRSTGG